MQLLKLQEIVSAGETKFASNEGQAIKWMVMLQIEYCTMIFKVQ